MSKESGIYVFPMGLMERVSRLEEEGNDAANSFPYVEISLVEQSLATPKDTDFKFKSISIFTPDNIKNADGIDFGRADMGFIKELTASLSNKGIAGTLGSINFQDVLEVGKQLKADMLNAFIPSITAAIEVSSRAISNPNTVKTFNGVDLRSFGLSVKLVPENKEESDRIRDIENILRYYMYPEKTGLLTLRYPATFRVKFMYGDNENKYMPFYHDAYITGLNVDYNPDGNSYHKGGAPNSIQIDITFTESFSLTRNDLYYNASIENGDTVQRDILRSQAYILSKTAADTARQVINQAGGG
jgi:hypothetical protein